MDLSDVDEEADVVNLWSYNHDELNNYITLHVAKECEINEFEFRMCLSLKNMFLELGYDEGESESNKCISNIEITKEKLIKYNISNVIMLSKYMESKGFESVQFFGILDQIIDIYYASIDALLNPNQIVFDMDKIFFDFRTKKIYMIYVPIDHYAEAGALKRFVESYCRYMSKFNRDNEAIYLKIAEYADHSGFCIEGFRNLLSYYKNQAARMDRIRMDREYIEKSNKLEMYELYGYEAAESFKCGGDFEYELPDYNQNQYMREASAQRHPQNRVKPMPRYEEVYGEFEADEEEHFKEQDEKNIDGGRLKSVLKRFVITYILLFISFGAVLFAVNTFMKNRSESTLFVIILFVSIMLYCYIKFFHDDIMEAMAKKSSADSSKHGNEKSKSNQVKKEVKASKSKKTKVKEKRKMEEPVEAMDMEADEYMEFEAPARASGDSRRNIPMGRQRGYEGYDNPNLNNRNPKRIGNYVNNVIKLNTPAQDYGNFSSHNESYHALNSENKYYETQVLSEFHEPYLLNASTGEKYYLNKPVIKMGRHNNENDYIIDRQTVGRFHVQINVTKNVVSLMDLGSKNGTYVNDERLAPYTKHLLNNEDIIRIADVSFSYKLA